MARPLDIRVVGGGIAGVMTGLELLRGRHATPAKVTVYERAAQAHTTLCGEGLSQETLARFTAFDSLPFVAEEFPGAAWHFPGGVKIEVDQRCYTMARETWIPAMAEAFVKAGGEYRTGVKVTEEDVRTMAREADLVIGADGPGSVVRKVVGGTHETSLGIQYRVAHDAYETDRLEFFTDKRYSPEYSWIFPRKDMLNVGLLADPHVSADENWKRLDAFMEDRGVVRKVLRREAYPIGFFGTKLQRGNIVLVGDAAGLTNPITKGGMAAIIYAGEILAACVESGRIDDYERRVMDHPLTDPGFRKALNVIEKWSNADFERLARFAPRVMRVGAGSARRRYAWPLAKTLALNAWAWRDLNALIQAMGVSRQYSW